MRLRYKDQGITVVRSKGLIQRGISLFQVNKSISTEARGKFHYFTFMTSTVQRLTIGLAILYGSNHYRFYFDARPHYPRSLQSPDIFGLLGVPHRLPLLRDLRSIRIILNPRAPNTLYWGHQRQRGRLSLFTKILREHAYDSNQKSLLKVLEVRLMPPFDIAAFEGDFRPPDWGHSLKLLFQEMKEQNQYVLEELIPLRGIEKVRIDGAGARFAACMQSYLMGMGGEINTKHYDDKVVRRRSNNGTRWIKNTVSSRKWYEPEYNWDEFAERNKLSHLSSS